MTPKVLIIYATWTGNTEEIARILYKDFKDKGADVQIFECQQVNASDLMKYDICVFATYTFGRDGELPDEMYGLYDDLLKIDLEGKIYGVLGSGDLYYEYYCRAVDEIDKRLAEVGGIKGVESLKIDTSATEEDKIKINKFAQTLLDSKPF